MPINTIVRATAVLTLLSLVTARPALAERWKRHRHKELGVTMLAPRGATFEKKHWDGGWRGVEAAVGGLKLTVAVLPGNKITAGMMREKAEKLSGLERDRWTVIKTFKARRGWVWYCTARAAKGDRVAHAVYGIGPRATTYLMLVTGDKKRGKKLRKQLVRWTRSITLK